MSQKTLLSFLLTTTMALSLFCQTSDIKTIQSIRSSFQIVRHWEFGISVIYAHTVDNNGVFIICDTTTPNQAKAFFLPAGIKVYDFELGPENVHFCGSENDSLGIVGWFNIPNVLLYSDNVRIAKIIDPFPDGAMVKRITKMDYHYMPFVNQYRYAAIGDIVLFRGGSADTLTTILDIGTDYSNWFSATTAQTSVTPISPSATAASSQPAPIYSTTSHASEFSSALSTTTSPTSSFPPTPLPSSARTYSAAHWCLT